MQSYAKYNGQYELYFASKTISWDYSQDRPYKGDTISGDRRMYHHLYYNPEKAAEDGSQFNRFMKKLETELFGDKRESSHETVYKKYFTVKKTPVRGIQVEPIEKTMDEAKKHFGYFVLLSNEVMDPVTALELYRNRDVVEKAFGNL